MSTCPEPDCVAGVLVGDSLTILGVHGGRVEYGWCPHCCPDLDRGGVERLRELPGFVPPPAMEPCPQAQFHIDHPDDECFYGCDENHEIPISEEVEGVVGEWCRLQDDGDEP